MTDLKSYADTLDKKAAAVLGLGASGVSVVRALVKAGVKVTAWDDSEQGRISGASEGAVIAELDQDVLKECDFLLAAPGVPLTHPAPHPSVTIARELGLEIIGDVELFYRAHPDRRIIALTGTNGKSTTTTLIHHILNSCGIKAALGGNIGVPVLDMKLPPKNGAIVLELSSFQIDLCKDFTAEIAVILNVTPDHIDRHGTLEDYAAIKERIFKPHPLGGSAVIGVDDKHCEAMLTHVQDAGHRRAVPVSVTKEVSSGVYAQDGMLFDSMDGGAKQEIGVISAILKLQGIHNHQNIVAAYAVARLFDVKPDDILAAIKTYPGLAHRQFPVRVISGVAYINDSKATNAEAAGKALACHKNIYWILGGKPKEGGLSGLEIFTENIRHAFLIGVASDDFAHWLGQHGVDFTLCGTLDVAVAKAHEMAQLNRGQPGGSGVVLLSPACASYDQFKSFEHRGDVFTQLVLDLQEEGAV